MMYSQHAHPSRDNLTIANILHVNSDWSSICQITQATMVGCDLLTHKILFKTWVPNLNRQKPEKDSGELQGAGCEGNILEIEGCI